MPIRAVALIALPLVSLLPTAQAAATKPAFSPIDVFALEWASDPQISPDGAQVAYVRQSFDIKSDSRRRADLARRPRRRQSPAARGRRGQPGEPALVAGRQARSPSSPRTATARRFTCTGSRRASPRASPTCLRRRPRLAWSPDGRQLAFVMRVPAKREPLKVKLPEAPEGREVGRAAQGHRPHGLSRRRRGFPAGRVRAGVRRARRRRHGAPAHRRRLGPRRPRLVRRRQRDPRFGQPPRERRPGAERQRDPRRRRRDRRDPRADQALRARCGARRSPDGKYIAYTGFDDALPGLPARAPVPHAPRQRRSPRARRRPRPRRPEPDLEPRRPAHLLPVRRPGHDAHRRMRPRRARDEPRRRPRRRRLVAALRRRLVLRRARRQHRLQRERRPRSRRRSASSTAASRAA